MITTKGVLIFFVLFASIFLSFKTNALDDNQYSAANIENAMAGTTPPGTFIRYPIKPNGDKVYTTAFEPAIQLNPFPPTGLEKGVAFQALVKDTLALNKVCEGKHSPYYEVLEYKNVTHTKLLANGNSISTLQLWANVKNVGNPSCFGWAVVKKTPTDTTGISLFKNGYLESHEFASLMCPSGWKVGYEDEKYIPSADHSPYSEFECFALMNTSIPEDYVCKDFGSYNTKELIKKKQLSSQFRGVINCRGGKATLSEVLKGASLGNEKQVIEQTVTEPVVEKNTCTTEYKDCEIKCMKGMLRNICINGCAKRYCKI